MVDRFKGVGKITGPYCIVAVRPVMEDRLERHHGTG